MKYYSEELNKMYDTEDDLLEAEFQAKKAREEAEAVAKAKAAEKPAAKPFKRSPKWAKPKPKKK